MSTLDENVALPGQVVQALSDLVAVLGGLVCSVDALQPLGQLGAVFLELLFETASPVFGPAGQGLFRGYGGGVPVLEALPEVGHTGCQLLVAEQTDYIGRGGEGGDEFLAPLPGAVLFAGRLLDAEPLRRLGGATSYLLLDGVQLSADLLPSGAGGDGSVGRPDVRVAGAQHQVVPVADHLSVLVANKGPHRLRGRLSRCFTNPLQRRAIHLLCSVKAAMLTSPFPLLLRVP